MTKEYSQLLVRFSAFNHRLKAKMVTVSFLRKAALLFWIFILQSVFLLASLPFFIFFQPRLRKNKGLEAVTAAPQRFQQALVLSVVGVLMLVVAFQTVFSSLVLQENARLHSAAFPVQFTGSRSFEEDIPLAISDIAVSSWQNTVTFRGTGPSYANVALFVDNGESLIAPAQVDGKGDWSFTYRFREGFLTPGQHSAYAVFYGDDNAVIGQPSPMKTFFVSFDAFLVVSKYFGLNTLLIALLALGILAFSIAKIRKTVTA